MEHYERFLTLFWTMIVLISLNANSEAYLSKKLEHSQHSEVNKTFRRQILSAVSAKNNTNSGNSMSKALDFYMYLTRRIAVNKFQFQLIVMKIIHLFNLSRKVPSDTEPLPHHRQLKMNTQQIPKFPVFRFYFPANQGYISPENNSKEITTKTRDPFSSNIEWEWLAQPQFQGLYLRHKRTGNYLCFNQNGRPSSRKHVKMQNCLLHGSLPKFPFNKNFPQTSQFDVNSSNETLALSERRRMPMSLQNKTDNELMTKLKSLNLERKDKFPHFSIPTFVRLLSRKQKPSMAIGFCENGRAFSNKRPYSGSCSHAHLPRLWDLLLICPPITSYCRLHCSTDLSIFSLSGTEEMVSRPVCPEQCRFSVSCGHRPNIFPMNI